MRGAAAAQLLRNTKDDRAAVLMGPTEPIAALAAPPFILALSDAPSGPCDLRALHERVARTLEGGERVAAP